MIGGRHSTAVYYICFSLSIFYSTVRYFEGSVFDWYHPSRSKSTRRKPQLSDSPLPFWQQNGLLYLRGWSWVLGIASLITFQSFKLFLLYLVLDSHKYTHSSCGLNSAIAQLEAMWETQKNEQLHLQGNVLYCTVRTNELDSLAGYILKLYFMPIQEDGGWVSHSSVAWLRPVCLLI